MEVSSYCFVVALCKGSFGLLVFNPNYIKWVCTVLDLKRNLKYPFPVLVTECLLANHFTQQLPGSTVRKVTALFFSWFNF